MGNNGKGKIMERNGISKFFFNHQKMSGTILLKFFFFLVLTIGNGLIEVVPIENMKMAVEIIEDGLIGTVVQRKSHMLITGDRDHR